MTGVRSHGSALEVDPAQLELRHHAVLSNRRQVNAPSSEPLRDRLGRFTTFRGWES